MGPERKMKIIKVILLFRSVYIICMVEGRLGKNLNLKLKIIKHIYLITIIIIIKTDMNVFYRYYVHYPSQNRQYFIINALSPSILLFLKTLF